MNTSFSPAAPTRPTPTRPGPLTSHRVDLVALFFGVAFLAVGGGAIADQLGWINVTGRAWMGVFLVTIGAVVVVGLVAAALRQRHMAAPDPAPTTD